MQSESSLFEELVKIQRSSNMEFDVNLSNNLSELLEYRKLVAIEILKTNNDVRHSALNEIYEYTNSQIKKLINI